MTTEDEFNTGYGSPIVGFLRVCGFFALIFVMTPVHVAFGFWKPSEPFRIIQIFHRILTRILGFHVRVHGVITKASPTLFVSNHTSYLDIPVLAALIPAAFVAKSEVADWPLIGRLAKLQNTVFIERRVSKAADHRDNLSERLAKGQSLILFPEGTSSDGLKVLPFKSSLFSLVEKPHGDKHLTVQPVSIACTGLNGMPITRAYRPFYTWFGDMTLPGHLWNVFKFGHFTIDVIFHAPVDVAAFPDRKTLASYCQQQVARGIDHCLTGRGLATTDVPQLPAPVVKQLADAKT